MELFKLFGTIAVNNDSANDSIDETTDKAEGAENRMSSAFKKIGAAVAAAFAVDKIIDFGKSIVDAASTVAAEQSAFEQIMGDYTDVATQKVAEIADATGMVATRLTPYMTSMTAKFKGLGYDIDDATTLASNGLNLAADAAAFWDVSLDDSMSHLNSFINGSYEGGEAIGLFANDTQMAAYAVQQGIVQSTKDWAALDEATKQATRLEYAELMFEQSGATGQAAKEADQYANVQANLTEMWRQFKAEIGEPVLQNIVLPAMQKLQDLLPVISQNFQELKTWVSENKGLLTGLAIAVGVVTTAITLQSVVQGVKAAMNAAEATSLWALIAAKAADAAATLAALAPYLLIAAAIAALIAVIVLLVKNWDKVKEVATTAWEGVKTAWGNVGDWFNTNVATPISDTWNKIKEKTSEKWNQIKDAMTVAAEAAKETVKEKLQKMKEVYEENGGGIKGIVAATIEGIKGFYTAGYTFIDKLTNGKLSEIVKKFKDYMTKAKEAVFSKIDEIKNKFTSGFTAAKNTVTNIFDSIKSKISSIMDSARSIVSNAIDRIKSIFNFSWSLPRLKLPHVNITGEFSLVPPSVPHFSIDWYKNGGIMTEPTLFDYNPASGKAKVGGEAGDEAIAPIDTLLGYVKTAVKEEMSGSEYYLQKLVAMLADYFPEIVGGMDRQLVLDSGVLVGQLAQHMDSKLGDINGLRKRGL